MGRLRIQAFAALVALSALLLAPVCEALEPAPSQAQPQAMLSAPDEHDSGTCCDALSAGGSVIPVAVPAAPAPDCDGAPLEAPALRLKAAPSAHAALGPPRDPPRSLRYHARTARILA